MAEEAQHPALRLGSCLKLQEKPWWISDQHNKSTQLTSIDLSMSMEGVFLRFAAYIALHFGLILA
jgi:hypothetical protein